MPLRFTGESGSSPEFEKLLEAFDENNRVVVVTSTEAIEDHSLDAVQKRASEKYDQGIVDGHGRVWVLLRDL